MGAQRALPLGQVGHRLALPFEERARTIPLTRAGALRVERGDAAVERVERAGTHGAFHPRECHRECVDAFLEAAHGGYHIGNELPVGLAELADDVEDGGPIGRRALDQRTERTPPQFLRHGARHLACHELGGQLRVVEVEPFLPPPAQGIAGLDPETAHPKERTQRASAGDGRGK